MPRMARSEDYKTERIELDVGKGGDFLGSFGSAQPSLFSFLRREQPKREAENELLMRPNELLVEQVGRLFGVERKAVEEGRAQIDTGGPNFDRFVVRQKSASDNPFASIVGGSKWNERGIKWEDGNIRLVDKNGNSLLGTEVGVNDRSVDIPLKRWLEIANGIVNFQQTQRDYVTKK
uniref:Uncharacterized protein n=1 Tax=Meloidogyne floridensis TaxID=298350 RepID=A0A915PAK9_9BILA